MNRCRDLLFFLLCLCFCLASSSERINGISRIKPLDRVAWSGGRIDFGHNGTYFKDVELLEKMTLKIEDKDQEEHVILLIDSKDFKLTAMLDRSTKVLTAVGVETEDGWILVDAVHGIDYEWPRGTDAVTRHKIDMNFQRSIVAIFTEHFELKLGSNNGLISMQCKYIHRSGCLLHKGILGDFSRISYLDIGALVNQWTISRGHLYSCNHTSLESQRSRNKSSTTILMQGPFFDNQGFSIVNRHLWLQFMKSTNLPIRAIISPSDTINLNRRPYSVLGHLLRCQLHASQHYNAKCPDIVFRNSWLKNGPDWTSPSCSGSKWIQQQPWEFVAIPKSWISAIQQTFQLWVPSRFCQCSYVKNGIDQNKIAVIPHGVSWSKYRHNYNPFHFDSPPKPLRILICGGLLPRKGIDIAVRAYIRAFAGQQIVGNVSLVIHSIYGDNFFLEEIEELISKHVEFPDFYPEIILLKKDLTATEMIRLFKSVSIFVSPYRSEGFGMLILEAMSAGLPVIVPNHGPALEFTSAKSAFYIKTKWPTHCDVYPCGNHTIFNNETIFQPIWSEPDQVDLARIFQHVYWMDKEELKFKAAAAIKESKFYDWPSIFNEVMKVVNNTLQS